MPEIDPVILRLETDLRDYQAGLAQAERLSDQSLSAIARNGLEMGQNFRQGFDLAKSALSGLQAIADVVDKSLKYASSIRDLSKELGVTTTALQEFRYAGAQAGLSVKESDEALEQLAEHIREAAKGGKEQAKTFETLGIKVKDTKGHVLDAGAAFPLIAGALQKIESPAQRAALLVELFGEKGRRLEPLLSGGTKSVDGLRDAAHRFGVVLSEEQIQNAHKAAAKINEVKLVLEAKIAGVVANNAGAIIDLANAFGRLAGQAIDLFNALSQLAKSPVGEIAGKLNTFLSYTTNPLKPGIAMIDLVSRAHDQATRAPSPPSNKGESPKRHSSSSAPPVNWPEALGKPMPGIKSSRNNWRGIPYALPKQNYASAAFEFGPSPLEGWTPGAIQGGLAAISAIMATEPSKTTKTVRAATEELEKLRKELDLADGKLGQSLERIGVKGLQTLENGLFDAIRGVKDLGEAFKDVANQIIADLLRIAIRQAIIKPLADLIFRAPAPGGGNVGGNTGSIPLWSGGFINPAARASGGSVDAGRLYRINEAGSPGRVEGFVPQGAGEIIPLGRMNALASSARSGPAVINVTVNAKDAVLTHTVQQWVREGVTAAAQLGTLGGAAEGERRMMSRGRRRIPG